MAGVYEKAVDRESAYERLKGRAQQPVSSAQEAQHEQAEQSQPWYASLPSLGSLAGGLAMGSRGGRRGDSMGEAMMKSAARSIGSSVGRQIVRGVLGSILRRQQPTVKLDLDGRKRRPFVCARPAWQFSCPD